MKHSAPAARIAKMTCRFITAGCPARSINAYADAVRAELEALETAIALAAPDQVKPASIEKEVRHQIDVASVYADDGSDPKLLPLYIDMLKGHVQTLELLIADANAIGIDPTSPELSILDTVPKADPTARDAPQRDGVKGGRLV